MTELTEREQWAKGLRDLLVSKSSQTLPNRAVTDRLSALLFPDPVVEAFADTQDADMRVNGRILVFTEQLVAVLDFAGADYHFPNYGGPDQSVSDVRMVPRFSLAQIRLQQSEDDPRVNTSHEFKDLNAHEEFPPYTALELHYPQLSEPVTISSARHPKSTFTWEFLTSLRQDLAKR